MNEKEKNRILIFARNGFRQFYSENHFFLEDKAYKPGKKTYRNMTAINKMMECFLEADSDYIIKDDVKRAKGWDGPSTYVQQERIITNFGLSDTPWNETDRSILLLSKKGISLRDEYKDYVENHPGLILSTITEVPDFAREVIINEIKNTNSTNMTLWKNMLITGLYLYSVLGRIPRITPSEVTASEKKAFIQCCNYINESGNLMDVDYFTQIAHMLSNLRILDDDYALTELGYEVIRDLSIFKEIEVSISDYKDVFDNEEEVGVIEEILDDRIELTKVEAPERTVREATVKHIDTKSSGPKNKDFDEADKTNRQTGNIGEKLVLEYEKSILQKSGIEDIDNKVVLTAEDPKYGNAYPCDIISVDPDSGLEVYIEVKTTRYGPTTPFYISEEERRFSEEHATQYRLYRVFDAIRTRNPKFFETDGYVGDNYSLKSDRYIASRDIEE